MQIRAMATEGLISLIVPSRGRPALLRRFLDSVACTAAEPNKIELVLVCDADDPPTQQAECPGLSLNRVVVPPGLSMGALNQAGYHAARGRFLMLLNDDVMAQTPGWDRVVRAAFRLYPDDIALLHVNDTVMQQVLCTFPIVSRRFCELVGGICPTVYRRYRIDDHIEDWFNLLGLLGEKRTIYFPEVVFEHDNYVVNPQGVRQYFSDPEVLAIDAKTFDELLPQRKEEALRVKSYLTRKAIRSSWRRRLARVADSLALRVPSRLRVMGFENGTLREQRPPHRPLWRRLLSGGWRRLRQYRSLLTNSTR